MKIGTKIKAVYGLDEGSIYKTTSNPYLNENREYEVTAKKIYPDAEEGYKFRIDEIKDSIYYEIV